jgi:two-component system phosphate regulon response regulator PhoB
MSQSHILIVDDDQDVLDVMTLLLTKSDFQVTVAGSARDGLLALKKDTSIDLLVLDVMLPGMNGLELLRALRLAPETKSLPIILHSSVGEEDVVVKGLELGADDYITKQTSTRIKVSRIRTALRRLEDPQPVLPPSGPSIALHELELFPESGKLLVEGEDVPLSDIQLRILFLFMRHPGVLQTKDLILSYIRQEHPEVKRSKMESEVSDLLSKLKRANRHVEKILGVGYRMKE